MKNERGRRHPLTAKTGGGMRAALVGLGLGLSVLLLGAPPTVAQGAGPGEGIAARWALRAMLDCEADARRLCGGVTPGGGRIAACLGAAQSELQPACAAHLAKGETLRATMQACAGDVKRYCDQVTPGGGRVASCLSGNRDRLSQSCRAAIDDAWAALRP